MLEKEVELVMWHIITRLRNMGKWGGAHSELKRVVKSLPSQYPGSSQGKKLVKKAIKNLKNLGFIGIYKKTKEDHTSLNPRKTKEIRDFVRKVRG